MTPELPMDANMEERREKARYHHFDGKPSAEKSSGIKFQTGYRKNVMVVGAHADDEALGCGGTIARHVADGDKVHIVIMAEGGTDVRKIEKERRPRTQREIYLESQSPFNSPPWTNAHKAASIMGVHSIAVHDYPDSRFDAVDILDLIHTLEKEIDSFRPQIVYTHHSGDLNTDHQRTHEAVVVACRPKQGNPVKSLYFYECPSSTEWNTPGSRAPFLPTRFVDITKYADKKEEVLMNAYGREMRDVNHPRSISGVYALAAWRGSSCGVEQAEAFMVGRQII